MLWTGGLCDMLGRRRCQYSELLSNIFFWLEKCTYWNGDESI